MPLSEAEVADQKETGRRKYKKQTNKHKSLSYMRLTLN